MTPPAMKNSFQRRDFGNPGVQIVLLLIVIGLFSWFIVKPKYSQMMSNKAQLAEANQRLVKITDDERELNKMVDELRSSSKQVELLDEALPLNGRISKVYYLLDSYVKSSGMSLSLLSSGDTTDIISAGDKTLVPDPYKDGRALHTVTVTAAATGTMEQFKSLLTLIETSSRVLDVDSVQVIGENETIKYRITVKAYSYDKAIKDPNGKETSN